ncbi:MAG: type II secretion system F family protein [Oscillospiraceae bacterium]|jgi:type IV pilus assembly protein PilC|nr:type II secretion system F family protein [Oscillospiraceae bacterium]
MPKYRYTALNLENNKVSSVIDVKDEEDFRRHMRNQSLVPLTFKIVQERSVNYRLKSNEVSEFSRQMAGMLSSGITAVRAMEILKDRDFKPKLKAVYDQLHKDLQKGHTVSEAMQMQGRPFPELFVNMYASGEASGQLEKVAAKMGEHYEKEHRLNGKVKAAMRYPMILGVVTLLVVLAIFIFILPNFFESLGDMELPGLTKAVVAFSGFLQNYWYFVILGIMVLIAGFARLKALPAVAPVYDKIKLRLPVVGKLLRIIYTARFARTLSTLYSSGVSMLKALEITGTVINNKYIESQFDTLIKDVRNGETLSGSVSKIKGFDNKLANTILIGEEAGRLDSMLTSTADSFDYEAEMATGKLVQLMEPVMLIVMALVIGLVMISVMSPMMSIYGDASQLTGG